jgi:hypothetical protein
LLFGCDPKRGQQTKEKHRGPHGQRLRLMLEETETETDVTTEKLSRVQRMNTSIPPQHHSGMLHTYTYWRVVCGATQGLPSHLHIKALGSIPVLVWRSTRGQILFGGFSSKIGRDVRSQCLRCHDSPRSGYSYNNTCQSGMLAICH